jgi:hypothetical protein
VAATDWIVSASLSILQTEIRNAVGEITGTTGQGDVGDGRQTDHVFSEGALSGAIAYWKDGV